MDEQKPRKSHSGLAFFGGLLTGILVLVLAIGVTGLILYNKYGPVASEKLETLLESSVSSTITSSTSLPTTVDLKTVSYSESGSDHLYDVSGLADIGAPLNKTKQDLVIHAKVSADDYASLAKHVPASADSSKDLYQNYQPLAVFFIATVLGNTTTTISSITMAGVTYTTK
jgi:hypothetical protein